jgi:cell division protein FtsN
MEKSYLEIKVTFQHILILLAGVIIIGSFLFYLGYQAGKSSLNKSSQTAKAGDAKSIEISSEDDPDKIEQAEEPSISEEIKLHQQPTEGEKQDVKPAKPLNRGTYFSVQVGAFNSHTLAKNYSMKFSKAGYPTSISQALVKGRTWYRVRVGNYSTRAEAVAEKKKLEKMENKKFAVVRPD